MFAPRIHLLTTAGDRTSNDIFLMLLTGVRSLLGTLMRVLPADTPQKFYSTVLSPRLIRAAVNAAVRTLIPTSIILDGKKLYLNSDDVVIAGALALGIYEAYPREIFRKHVKTGATVVDVGANIGVYTLTAHAAGGRVIAYEPDTKNRETLLRSLKENAMRDVVLRAEALGDVAGVATLHLHPDNAGKHSLLNMGEHEVAVTVPVVTLDESLAQLGILRVDVMKIDVEGYEAHVITGGMRMIRRDRPVLFFEYAPVRIRLAGKDPTAMLTALRALGYEISVLNEHSQVQTPVDDLDMFVKNFSHKDAYINILACVPSTVR